MKGSSFRLRQAVLMTHQLAEVNHQLAKSQLCYQKVTESVVLGQRRLVKFATFGRIAGRSE